MKPGIAKINEKVRISTYFECPDSDYQIAENACCIEYADTWSSKWVHWLTKGQSTDRGTTNYGCEHMVEFDNGDAWAGLPITRIHPRVAHESNIQWLPATLHSTRWIDHGQVCHGSVKAIPVLGALDVEKVYSYSASHHHWLQWHVQSYGRHYASFS